MTKKVAVVAEVVKEPLIVCKTGWGVVWFGIVSCGVALAIWSALTLTLDLVDTHIMTAAHTNDIMDSITRLRETNQILSARIYEANERIEYLVREQEAAHPIDTVRYNIMDPDGTKCEISEGCITIKNNYIERFKDDGVVLIAGEDPGIKPLIKKAGTAK